MTRFLFITDTHIGAPASGWHQQPAYPDRLGELLAEIEQIARSGSIDFVLHGGDMVDSCTRESIFEAKRLFRLSVPVYLSVGNHDLDRENAKDVWLELAPEFFNGPTLQYSIHRDDCAIHVLPNQWEQDVPYYWNHLQVPYFLDEQLQRLQASLTSDAAKIHLLSIHNPIFGIPVEQSGAEDVLHDVPASFRHAVLNLMKSHPQVKGVLSGHNHANTLKRTDEGVFVSGSSFVETPFEYKLIEVTGNSLRISTQASRAKLSFTPDYDGACAYVQGRDCDRTIIWKNN